VSPTRSRYGRCRSCRALIVWCETTSGRRMPVDLDRVPEGNVKLIWRKHYDEPLALVLGSRQLERERAEVAAAHEQGISEERELLLYTSHFATCRHAERWRRRRTAAA
jgi:hypothetical protein